VKINPIHFHSVNPYKRAQRNVSATTTTSNFEDKIEISKAAKEMQITSDFSAERAAKVQSLKQQIQSGEYQVDAGKVAKDLLKYYRP